MCVNKLITLKSCTQIDKKFDIFYTMIHIHLKKSYYIDMKMKFLFLLTFKNYLGVYKHF